MGVKTVVFNIEKFATRDGPGIRTVVFLKGCPLRCMWCHSPESRNGRVERYPDGTTVGTEMTLEEILEEVLKDRDFYEASGGGMTLSGGEPMFHWEFAAKLLARARKDGLDTAIETSGYAPLAAFEAVVPYVNTWLFDIKGMDAAKHREHVGVDNAPILRNLRWLDARKAEIVLRCPMIPGVNDSDDNLGALAKLANSLVSVQRIDIEPYIPYGVDKAKRLGLKVYEAPQPPAAYAELIVERLRTLTEKLVCKG